jgi:membrane protein YdbS with pleckstrin-like domain
MERGVTMEPSNDIFRIERPHQDLFTYYVLTSLVLGPFFFFLLLPLYFRYHTLRYRFDEEGVSMSWGILFRREIHLTYSRIQDIHLVSNVVERWLGLARIQIQTASGSSKAEMTLEGLKEFARVRDFLYGRMRGTREEGPGAPSAARGPAQVQLSAEVVSELVMALRAVAGELRALRRPNAVPPPETPPEPVPVEPGRPRGSSSGTPPAPPERSSDG